LDKNYVSSGEVKVGLVCVTDIRRLNLNTQSSALGRNVELISPRQVEWPQRELLT